MNAQKQSASPKPEHFRQSLGDPIGWRLVEGDKTTGTLRYQKGEEIAVVPNIWYNQPVVWRIQAMLWNADRARERIDTLCSDPFPKPWHNQKIASAQAQVKSLEGLAEQMKATGKVLA